MWLISPDSELKTQWEAQTQLSFIVIQWLQVHLLSPQCYIKLLCLFYCDVATGLQLQFAPHLKSWHVSKHVNIDAFVHIAELQALVQKVHQNENFLKRGSQKPPFVYSDRYDQWTVYR